MGGIHSPDNKLSADKAIEVLSAPSTVYITLAHHLGVPAKPIVKPMDYVKVGQLIAEGGGFISANIHSSVSGTVKKIDTIIDSTGYKQDAIIIDAQGDEWLDEIDRSPEIKKDFDINAEQLFNIVKNSGIVGLGGAAFPTHVKFKVPDGKVAEYLVINGVECEPYLTSDHRLMLEKGEEILVGIDIVMKALNVKKAIIGIENNKEDAIKLLEKLTLEYDGIEIIPLNVCYPQGGEKQLVKSVLNREIPPPPGLPIDVGCIVTNVGTVFAIYEAVQKNKPLIERVVTVTGKSLKKPSNYLVRIGALASDLIDAAGGLPEDTGKIINGGPMMGKALTSSEAPITKGTSGIVLVPLNESKRKEVLNCIRCAKCVDVCPAGLEPYLLMALGERDLFDKAEEEKAMYCIECGCCSFVCPSNRPLLDYIRLDKSVVMKNIRARADKNE